MRRHTSIPFARKLLHRLLVGGGSATLALAFLLVLPLMKSISKPPENDLTLRTVDVANLPPPPPPPPEPEPDKQEQPEPPPELQPEAAPLDLSQLELALSPNVGGLMAGDFGVKLPTFGSGGSGVGDVDELFSLADLDQKPRVVHQPGPVVEPALRRKAPASVNVLFIVDQRGRVESPMVQSSTDAAFERPALNAVKQWRFEPGKRNGKEVRFRMRVPITFPAGS